MTSTVSFSGSFAVQLSDSVLETKITHPFARFDTSGITFIDFYGRPVAGKGVEHLSPVEADSSSFGFFRVDTVGQLLVFDGNGSGGGRWKITPRTIALDETGAAQTWHRFTLRENYNTKTWDLYVDGGLVAWNLRFKDSTANHLSVFSVTSNATATGLIDYLYVGGDNPLFVDADNDGMDDAWETAHGLNPAVNDRDLDPDGDGLTNIEEFARGTNPQLADSDGDGMPDGWEVAHHLNPLVNDAAEDPDGDGKTNLQEYLDHTNPWPDAIVPTGLTLWLRADLGITKDSSNRVSAWEDMSDSNYILAQTDSNVQPLWVAAGLNGKAALQFDSIHQVLKTPGVIDLQAGSSDVTVIAVVKPEATQPYRSTILDADHDNTGGLILSQDQALTNQFYLWWEDFDLNDTHSAGSALNPGLVQVVSVVKSGGNVIDYVNGAAQNTASVGAEILAPLTAFAVGNQASPAYGFNGEISEILVYNRSLTATEREQIEAQLKTKYINSDSDADGLPDEWELKYLDTLSYGATDDPGNVGRTLLQSYQTGQSPWPAAVVTSGLRAWYRADLGVNKDGSNRVSGWTDLSGNGTHVVQTADLSRQPLWVSGALNGNAAVQFDGSQQGLKTLSLVDLQAGSNDVTVIAVVKPEATQPYRATIIDAGHDESGGLALRQDEGSTNQFYLWWEDSAANERRSGGTTLTNGQAEVITVVKNGVSTVDYLNGAAQSTETVPVTMSSPLTAFAVGNQTSPHYGFNGPIAEVLVYNRALTTTERQLIETQLKTKYIAADSDADGLPDDWERSYLGTLSYGATDDPGNVGRTLLQSYQTGQSPWPNPTVSGGLRVWFRADLGVEKDSSGAVSKWTDLSGNGLHVVQTADLSRQPLWMSSSINGKAAIQFDGNRQALKTPGLVDLQAGSSDVTVIAVVKPQATQPYRSTILDADHDNSGGMALRQDEGSTNQFYLWWEDTAANERHSGGSLFSAGQVEVLSVVKNGSSVIDYLNGAAQSTSTTDAVISAPLTAFAVGNETSPYYGFNGPIAEVLVYNRALSTTERQQIEAQLKTRYINPDSDADGLPDEWELKYLGSLSYGATDDPGNVGRTLLQSYQTGQSPWPSATISTGLRAWYRADVGISKDSSNNVSAWTDLSGNGVHVVQTTDLARQPLWGSSVINGKAAVQFDGNRQVLKTPGLVDLQAGSTDVTVIAVMKPNGTQPYRSTILDADHDNSGGLMLSQDQGSTNQFYFWWDDSTGNERRSGGSLLTGGQVEVLTVVKNGTTIADYLNGTVQTTATVGADLLAPLTAFAVGNQTSPYYGFNGPIAEVLVYNRALSDTERQQIEAQMNSRYTATTTDSDSDGNGLPDAWELLYFGHIGVNPTADPDGDGVDNITEYKLGRNPTKGVVSDSAGTVNLKVYSPSR